MTIKSATTSLWVSSRSAIANWTPDSTFWFAVGGSDQNGRRAWPWRAAWGAEERSTFAGCCILTAAIMLQPADHHVDGRPRDLLDRPPLNPVVFAHNQM